MHGRLAELHGLQATLNQALRFYEAENVDYRLREAICRLWGMTFSAEETSNASTLLGKTLNGVVSENGIYGHSRFCNTDFDDKLACLNLSGV